MNFIFRRLILFLFFYPTDKVREVTGIWGEVSCFMSQGFLLCCPQYLQMHSSELAAGVAVFLGENVSCMYIKISRRT